MRLISFFDIGLRRWLYHIGLALFTAGGVYAAHLYSPYADTLYDLTIGCGYVALIFLVVSLLIGPYYLLYRRRNPVNMDFRRDVGIWSAIAGCIHVACGFTIYQHGQIVYYFLVYVPQKGYRFLVNIFGVSNDLGLIATCILVVLLVLSNNIALRQLKGKKWKNIQRFNYVLAVLVFAHTFGYQIVSRRPQPFVTAAIILAVLTLAAQSIGFLLYRSRHADHRLRV